MNIRQATTNDYDALCGIDSVAEASPERRIQICNWLESARCYVVQVDGQVIAYGVLTSHFFGHSFIEMVMVDKKFRRQGVGAAIIEHLRSVASSSKLFTSTNKSNVPMQMLFAKLGFKRSGQIDNLDHGDPEIIFYCAVAKSL
jgi:ribosomal protein S18 acetylase RimI-like enzyme